MLRKKIRIRVALQRALAKKIAELQKEDEQENEEVSPSETIQSDTLEDVSSGFNERLKTVVLCIYNINQNGTANMFCESMSDFISDDKGNITIKDMSPEALTKFFTDLSMAKEIKLPDLGLRLILLIYNCNQNGTSNVAELGDS
mgnify:FL=1